MVSKLNQIISRDRDTYWTTDGKASDSSGSTSKYYYGIQCKGYASSIFNEVFGHGYIGAYSSDKSYIPSPNGASQLYRIANGSLGSGDSGTVSAAFASAAPGDFVQMRRRGKDYGHSQIVVSTSGSGVTFLDCNADGHCKIQVYEQSWATFASKNSGFSIYRADGYNPGPVNQPPIGDVNSATGGVNCVTVRGWAFDPDDPGASIAVHFYLDGPAGVGTGIAGVTANVSRPDVDDVYHVGANHGFEATISCPAGTHTIYVHAIDTAGGDNPVIGSKSATVSDYSLPDYNYGAYVTLPEGNGTYTIASVLDPRLFVEVKGSSTENGANVQLWGGEESDNRQWVFTQNGDGTYTITNAHSGKALDVTNASMVGGANIQQWTANGSGAQHWWVQDCGDGTYALRVNHSRGFLDVTNAVAADGTNMQQCKGNGSDAQKFLISKSYGLSTTLPDGDGIYTVSPASNKGIHLDVHAASVDDGANVQIYEANCSTAQRFQFTRNADGSYLIANERSGKLLDVQDKSRLDSANVQQWGVKSALSRSWWIEDLGGGVYNIKSVYSGRCLDIAGGMITSGTNVQQFRANGSAAQRWTLEKVSGTAFSHCTMTLSPTSYTYDGTQRTPTVTVKDGSTKLEESTNYTLDWQSGRTNAGTYTVTATGKGSYPGTKTASFTISPKPISSCTITLSQTSYTYDGSQKTPTLTVKDGSKTLAKDTDYTVSWPAGRTNMGTYTVTVSGKGNYGGSATASFKVNAASLESAAIASVAGQTYTGSAITPKPAVTLGGRTLVEGTDFTYSYSGNVNASTASSAGKVTVTGKGNYTGSKSASFTISPKSLSGCTVALSASSYTYDGTQKSPTVTVKDGSKMLAAGTDYTLSMPGGRTNAGTYTYTVAGTGNYKDSKTATLTIGAKQLSACTVSLSPTSYAYDGTQKTPTFTVKDGSKTLAKDTDYTVSEPSGRTNAGTYTYTVTGKGNYTGTNSASFTIGAKSLSSCAMTLSPSSYTYDGTQKTPALTVKDGSTTLTAGTHYDVTTTPAGRMNAGTYTYVVTGKDSYKDTKSASFTIDAKSLSGCTVTLSPSSYAYDGTQKSPTLTVKDGSKTLVAGTDYTLGEPSGRTNAGTYTYTVTGKGNYKDSKSATLTISPKQLSACTVSLSPSSCTFDWTQKSPTLTVKDGSTTLTAGTHYDVTTTPPGRTNAGAYTYVVTGKGNYTGTNSATLTIASKSISSCTIEVSPTSYTYDGSQKAPGYVVKDGSRTLTEGVDYVVSVPSGRTNTGTYTYTITGKGNFKESKSFSFTVTSKSLSGCTVTLSQASYGYDGTQKSPTVTVKDGSKTLVAGTDYTLGEPGGRTNAGTYTYTVTGKGNYKDSKTATLTISPRQLSSCTVSISPTSYTYDGTQKSPALTVKDGSKTLAKDTDYTVSAPSGRTEPGTYTYTVTGKGNYTGSATASFTISKPEAKDISSCDVTLSPASCAYTGSAVSTPTVTVKDGSKTLVAGVDYTLATPSAPMVNAGKYTYTITGKGGYKNSKQAYFTINPKSLYGCTATLSQASYGYDGTQKSPTVTVKDGSKTLAAGTDYTLSEPSGRTNAGTYTYTVTGKGNYKDAKTATLTISPKQLSACTMTVSPASYGYDGSQKNPTVSVKDGSKTLARGTDYILAEPDGRTSAGRYTYTATGKGNYAGTTSAGFEISGVWSRLWGQSALDTMAAIAAEFGGADVAVVTTNADFKDALAASCLAGRHDALVLTTPKGSVARQTREALKNAGVKTVYLVGSASDVTDATMRALKSGTGVTKVERIGGSSASAKAIAVAKKCGRQGDTVIVASQANFKDALAIAPYSYATQSPILYAETSKKLSDATLKYIKSAGYKRVLIVGGPVALPESIDRQLANSAGIKAADISRLAGSTSYDTSLLIARWATGRLAADSYGTYKGKALAYVRFQPSVSMGCEGLGVASSQNWKDALCGAALCGRSHSVLLLGDASNSARALEFTGGCAVGVSCAYVLGGPASVSEAVWDALVASTAG